MSISKREMTAYARLAPRIADEEFKATINEMQQEPEVTLRYNAGLVQQCLRSVRKLKTVKNQEPR